MTNSEHSSLFWARQVNDDRSVGLFGPTLARHGVAGCPECEALVMQGLMRRIDVQGKRGQHGSGEHGYWITEAGREALQKATVS